MYRILELEVLGTNPIMKYRVNQQSGLYERLNAQGVVPATPIEEPRGLNDLIYTRLMKITKVQRTTDNVIFEIGTLVAANVTITSFIFIKNVVVLLTNSNANTNIPLANATIYVAPVVIPAPVTSGGRKVNNFQELQAAIERDNRPIKLGNKTNPFTHPSPDESLESFVKNFILTYNNQNDSCYVDSGRVQTERAKRRSLADLFMICKYYYPTCNLHDLIHILYVTLPANWSRLGSLICEQINKRVWWNYGTPRFSHDQNPDEYGNNQQWYLTKLRDTPVYEGAAETTGTGTAGNELLTKMKKTFALKTKFKAMSNGKTVVVDSTDFYDGVKTIILIQRDGTRRMIYDKVNKIQAKVIS